MKAVIYQILPRYWGNYDGRNVRGGSLDENGCGHFADIDDKSLDYFKSLGCTHVWYTGVIRHATSTDGCRDCPSHPQILKGRAGSPYAIKDYFDVNPYLADCPDKRMEEFEELIGRTHAHGLRVILDFVPNHVSRDNVNFGRKDNTGIHWTAENDFFYYPGEHLTLPVPFEPDGHFSEAFSEYPAKATGNNCFSSSPSVNDWYETVKLNYSDFHTGTWDRMLEILRFWISKGVDGFRCDMVELVPPEFFAWVIPEIKKDYPDILFIAEVYKKELYREYIREAGFDLLYDKSGLYDSLRDIMAKNSEDDFSPVELWQSTRRITSNWQFLQDLQPNMLNFLENHDEQRLCSSEFVGTAERSYAALAVSLLFNNAAFMYYFGQEIGEKGEYAEGFSGHDGRNSIFDWWKIESIGRLFRQIHEGRGLTKDESDILNRYRELVSYASRPEVSEGNTYDLCFCNIHSDGFDADRHFAFLRYNGTSRVLVVCNFSSCPACVDVDIPIFGTRKTVQVKPFDYTLVEF